MFYWCQWCGFHLCSVCNKRKSFSWVFDYLYLCMFKESNKVSQLCHREGGLCIPFYVWYEILDCNAVTNCLSKYSLYMSAQKYRVKHDTNRLCMNVWLTFRRTNKMYLNCFIIHYSVSCMPDKSSSYHVW